MHVINKTENVRKIKEKLKIVTKITEDRSYK